MSYYFRAEVEFFNTRKLLKLTDFEGYKKKKRLAEKIGFNAFDGRDVSLTDTFINTIKDFSLEFPDLAIELYLTGEKHGDLRRYHFRKGELSKYAARITYVEEK